MKNIIFILITLLTAITVNAQTSRDKKFVAHMAQMSLLEVKLGELSQINGLAIEVTDMGKHLIDDHTKALAELKALAAKNNIIFPTTLNINQQADYDKMAKLKGNDFDTSFNQYIAKEHKKMKSEMKKQVKKSRTMDIAAWAQNSLPLIQHHQDILKATSKSMKQ